MLLSVRYTLTFFRMSSANVRKAFSMLMLALALVSKNLIPCSLAICRQKGSKKDREKERGGIGVMSEVVAKVAL